MTSAYVIQVIGPVECQYVGRSARLQPIPYFFQSLKTVRGYLQRRGYPAKFYNADAHSELTKIIAIHNLGLGLKDSTASIYFYGQFLESTAPKNQILIKNNPQALYKLRLGNGRFVNVGPKKNRFGKLWQRAGDLRSHLTSKLESNSNIFELDYKGATVVELQYDKEGLLIEKVIHYPVKDFYVASPACRKQLGRHSAFDEFETEWV